jgi:hypothetical protein
MQVAILNDREKETMKFGIVQLRVSQAQAKFIQSDYIVGEKDQYGQRFTIVIEIRGKRLYTGWILGTDGILKLATPCIWIC